MWQLYFVCKLNIFSYFYLETQYDLLLLHSMLFLLCPRTTGIIAIAEINEALNSGDHKQTLTALLLPTAKLSGVNPATARHYHDVLQNTKQLLCQVGAYFFI